MPRYFFDIQGNGFPAKDQDGVLLEGPEAARVEAVRFAGELMTNWPDHFWASGEWRLHVTDEAGRTVCSLVILGSPGESGPA